MHPFLRPAADAGTISGAGSQGGGPADKLQHVLRLAEREHDQTERQGVARYRAGAPNRRPAPAAPQGRC